MRIIVLVRGVAILTSHRTYPHKEIPSTKALILFFRLKWLAVVIHEPWPIRGPNLELAVIDIRPKIAEDRSAHYQRTKHAETPKHLHVIVQKFLRHFDRT